MGASAALQSAEVTVAPGAEASVELRVRNTGTVVDQMSFQVLGTVAGWIAVEPPTVSLFPGAEETVRVVFRPPRVHTTLAGTSPFAVKVVSREDPEGSAVEEGSVTVDAFDDRNAELMPRTARGRRKAGYQVAIDNRGNARANVQLTPLDTEDAVDVALQPPAMAIEPGTAQIAKVRVKPRKRFWKGAPQTRQFQVLVEEQGKDPIPLQGSMLQESMLPPWLWKAALAVLALLILLFVLWQTLLKPKIESTAKDAAADPVQELRNDVRQAGVEVPAAGEGAPAAPPNDPTNTTVPVATTVPSGGGGGAGALGAVGDARDIRLAASIAAGATGTATACSGCEGGRAPFVVPEGQLFAMFDVILQNPNGDSGRVQVLRGGEVLFESALQNFRDLDYHFVAPYLFKAGEQMDIKVICNSAAQCDVAASISGFLGAAPAA
ncbi:MAG TPA: hypothetical protein VF855_10505 [Acidimicrobiales bacterium]